MAVWNDDTPADDKKANTLHTLIQACKADTMDRLRATNAAFDEHDIYGAGATGKHVVSKVGFCGVFATYALLEAAIAAGNGPDGSLHYISEAVNVGLYIIRSGAPERLGSSDHGALSGLTDDGHTQYILIDGSRAASGDHNIDGTLSVLTWGTDDDNPVPGTHVSQSWYGGHGGANCLKLRHFADDSVPFSGLKTSGCSFQAGSDYVRVWLGSAYRCGFFACGQLSGTPADIGGRNDSYITIQRINAANDTYYYFVWKTVSGSKSAPGYRIEPTSGVA